MESIKVVKRKKKMTTDPLLDIAIFVLWSIICFTIGRMFGRADQLEEEKENE